MSETPNFTDTLPAGLPDAAELIESMRSQLAEQVPPEQVLALAVARYPVLEVLAPVPVLAEWLGVKEGSIYTARFRTRGDGTPVWAEADATILGRMMWTFGGVALHRATAPGRGWNLRGEIRAGAR